MKNKKVVMEQEGKNWLRWRSRGIGASEVGVIMGALPVAWNDVLELYKLKSGLKESDFEMNEAMKRGKNLEPTAREKYIEVTKIPVEPCCYEVKELSFLKASLDGLSADGKQLVEIKVPQIGGFRQAKKGVVKDYYYSQVQYQALCSGAENCHYWVYSEKESVLINIPRNEEYIQELIRRATIFWNCVETKTPCLPPALNIDMSKDSDPFQAGDMTTELIGVYRN